MNKEEVRVKYAQYRRIFECNSFNLPIGNVSEDGSFAWYRLTQAKSLEFKTGLLEAVEFCFENNNWDLLLIDESVHPKTELFLDRLQNKENKDYAMYEALRKEGLYDVEDFVALIDISDKVRIKTKNTNINMLLDPDNEVYYEWSYVINGIEVYIKIIFGRFYLQVDIHGKDENYCILQNY